MSEQRHAILTKGRHRFLFVWPAGEETDAIKAAMAMVDRPGVPFDHFDGVMICERMWQHIRNDNQQATEQP